MERRSARPSATYARTAPPPNGPPADPDLAALRRLADSTHQIGELMLEVAPAYLSDAADVLKPLCAAIGENFDHALAARRYALAGDRRALHS